MRFLVLLALVGCGTARPDLPVEVRGLAGPGDADRGRSLAADPRAGRSGYACTDCHAAADELRPAPPLGGLAHQPTWWYGRAPSLEGAVEQCIERWQHRLPDPQVVADLVAALRTWPAPTPPSAGDPASTYAAACAGCHEQGSAGALLGRRWPLAHLQQAVLGPRSSPLAMPTFSPDRLPGADALLRWLADGGAAILKR